MAALLSLLPLSPVLACGWWGDGEASDSDDAIEVDANGRPLIFNPQPRKIPALLTPMKVPSAMGYGLAVTSTTKAVPYLNDTAPLAARNIAQLSALGYAAVIDLGTPPKVAALHRLETEKLGMAYFNIQGTELLKFADIVNQSANMPLLVYGKTKQSIEKIWTDYIEIDKRQIPAAN